jgi:hypothetical protein
MSSPFTPRFANKRDQQKQHKPGGDRHQTGK